MWTWQLIKAAAALPDGNPLRKQAEEWIEGPSEWLEHLDRGGDRWLSSAAAAQAQRWQNDAAQLRDEILQEKAARVRSELARSAVEARDGEKLAQHLLHHPRLADAIRNAFRSRDEDLLKELVEITGNITDSGLGFHELVRKASEAFARCVVGVELSPVSAHTETLEKLNRALVGLNLVLDAATNEEATTHLEEAMSDESRAVGAFSGLERPLSECQPTLGYTLTFTLSR